MFLLQSHTISYTVHHAVLIRSALGCSTERLPCCPHSVPHSSSLQSKPSHGYQVFLHLLLALTTDHSVTCKHHCSRKFCLNSPVNWSITIANKKGLRSHLFPQLFSWSPVICFFLIHNAGPLSSFVLLHQHS